MRYSIHTECVENSKTRQNTTSNSHRNKRHRYLYFARIKHAWRIQQKQQKVHERLKRKKILEYEIQHAHRLSLSHPKRKYSHGSSKSKSPPSSMEELDGSTGDMYVFLGPEDTQISSIKLHNIKVDIYRNIHGKSASTKLQRDIVNLEDVMVKRRAGERSKPIFEREELTKTVSNPEDDYRRVVTVKGTNTENKPQSSKRRSASSSSTKTRSHRHRRTSSRHSKHKDYKQDERENRRSNGNRGHTRSRSKERKDRRRTQSCHVGYEETRLNERNRNHLRSRERDRTKLDTDCHRSKSIGGRSRERRMPSQQVRITEQIGIPIYCGNFPPRSIMVGPLVPFRGQIAFGDSRHPVWPLRPFGPRFPPGIDMYRLRLPGNPRFGPQY